MVMFFCFMPILCSYAKWVKCHPRAMNCAINYTTIFGHEVSNFGSAIKTKVELPQVELRAVLPVYVKQIMEASCNLS